MTQNHALRDCIQSVVRDKFQKSVFLVHLCSGGGVLSHCCVCPLQWRGGGRGHAAQEDDDTANIFAWLFDGSSGDSAAEQSVSVGSLGFVGGSSPSAPRQSHTGMADPPSHVALPHWLRLSSVLGAGCCGHCKSSAGYTPGPEVSGVHMVFRPPQATWTGWMSCWIPAPSGPCSCATRESLLEDPLADDGCPILDSRKR